VAAREGHFRAVNALPIGRDPDVDGPKPWGVTAADVWTNDALCFRTLATLRQDVPVFDNVGDLRPA